MLVQFLFSKSGASVVLLGFVWAPSDMAAPLGGPGIKSATLTANRNAVENKDADFLFGESDEDFVFGDSDESANESNVSNESIEVLFNDCDNHSNDSIQDYSTSIDLNKCDQISSDNPSISYDQELQSEVNLAGNEETEENDNMQQNYVVSPGHSDKVGKHHSSGGEKVLDLFKNRDQSKVQQSTSKIIQNPDLCSLYCRNNCSTVFGSWSQDSIDNLLREFVKKSNLERKQAILNHLIQQSSMGIKKRGIFWNSHLLCVNFFSHITSISTYIINLVISDHWKKGFRQYEHGNSGCPKESPATVRFIAWMVQHVEIFGQDAPDEITKVMSSAFKKRELYETYIRETTSPHIKLSTFYSHLKSKFGLQRPNQRLPNVRFSKHSTHSRCDTCVRLDQLQRTSRSNDHLLYCKALKYKHRERYGKARQATENIKQLSLSFPNDFLTISIDDMDNQKSMLPRILEPGKKLSGIYKIPTKITGTITSSGLFPSGRRVAFYYNHDEFENGSNKLISILYKLILSFLENFKFLPRHLNLCLDNCFKENKNRFLFAFLCSLVDRDIFTEITVNYLLVGHTGNCVDQLFSIIANDLKKEICTIEDLVTIISNSSILPKPSCQQLEYTWDWKSFIIPNLYRVPLSQHSNFHSFQVRKEGVFPNQQTSLRAKKYPQDLSYGPPNGIIILNENIVYDPVPAADFRIEDLCLDRVFKDLNKFISRMPSAKAINVRQSWDNLRERLERKPRRQKNLPSMKISELPSQKRNDQPLDFTVDELEDDDLPELNGEEFPSELNEGEFDSEIVKTMDVVLYTERTVGRPWVGRVLEVLEDSCFTLQWFGRKSRGNTFHALFNKDKSPYTSKQCCGSVMMWEMSIEKEEKSFKLSNKTLEKIMNEYSEYDSLDQF